MWRNWNSCTLMVAMGNGMSNLQNISSAYKMLNRDLTRAPRHSIPRYWHKKNENMFIQRLVPEFRSNIIENSLKLEKSNSPLTDEWIKNYIFSGILSSKKKESTTTAYSMSEPWKHCVKWKKLDAKYCILYNPIYMEFLETAKLWGIKEVRGCLRLVFGAGIACKKEWNKLWEYWNFSKNGMWW